MKFITVKFKESINKTDIYRIFYKETVKKIQKAIKEKKDIATIKDDLISEIDVKDFENIDDIKGVAFLFKDDVNNNEGMDDANT